MREVSRCEKVAESHAGKGFDCTTDGHVYLVAAFECCSDLCGSGKIVITPYDVFDAMIAHGDTVA